MADHRPRAGKSRAPLTIYPFHGTEHYPGEAYSAAFTALTNTNYADGHKCARALIFHHAALPRSQPPLCFTFYCSKHSARIQRVTARKATSKRDLFGRRKTSISFSQTTLKCCAYLHTFDSRNIRILCFALVQSWREFRRAGKISSCGLVTRLGC